MALLEVLYEQLMDDLLWSPFLEQESENRRRPSMVAQSSYHLGRQRVDITQKGLCYVLCHRLETSPLKRVKIQIFNFPLRGCRGRLPTGRRRRSAKPEHEIEKGIHRTPRGERKYNAAFAPGLNLFIWSARFFLTN